MIVYTTCVFILFFYNVHDQKKNLTSYILVRALVSISSHDLRRTRQSDSAKYVKPTAPIDFSAYKKKLKFTGAAVDLLEV